MQMYHRSLPYSTRMVEERLSRGALLDVGGAACPDRANRLAVIARRVVIVDIDPPRAALAGNVTFLRKPVEELTAEDGCFDDVLLSNVIEHVEDPAVALAAVRRVLSGAGQVHVLTPNCESLNRRIGLRMGVLKDIREIPEAERLLGHRHMFTVADMRRLLEGAGFVIQECRGVFVKPVPTPEMILWPEARIQAFFDIAPEVPPELCHEVYIRAAGVPVRPPSGG